MGGGQSKEQQTIILKTTLDSACRRLKLQKDKMARERETKRLEICTLLSSPGAKDELWRDNVFLKAEQLMSAERQISGFANIDAKTELLKGRVGVVIDSDGRQVPQDVEELVYTLLWIPSRAASIDEFKKIKQLLEQKFAPAFNAMLAASKGGAAPSAVTAEIEAKANPKVKELFSTAPPAKSGLWILRCQEQSVGYSSEKGCDDLRWP